MLLNHINCKLFIHENMVLFKSAVQLSLLYFVNFIIRMQQSIFQGNEQGKNRLFFYNLKVKCVVFHKKNMFKHTIPDLGAQELASTAGIWGQDEKNRNLSFLRKSPGLGAGDSGSFVFLASAVWSPASAQLCWGRGGREGQVWGQILDSCLSYSIFIDFLDRCFFIFCMPLGPFPEALNGLPHLFLKNNINQFHWGVSQQSSLYCHTGS